MAKIIFNLKLYYFNGEIAEKESRWWRKSGVNQNCVTLKFRGALRNFCSMLTQTAAFDYFELVFLLERRERERVERD